MSLDRRREHVRIVAIRSWRLDLKHPCNDQRPGAKVIKVLVDLCRRYELSKVRALKDLTKLSQDLRAR
jgi:hypothetical protein